ncbi:MAG: hypothetical protein JO186_08320 [Actinobacteria bacterium]|nr:hypothetical protein [Actinomycetota bacterium]MBV8394828.1 hypothetical protein [Actinomycetota bacterium]MBV8597281.1 hypothetical protein [Actinomycetota bacterium]
MRTTWPLAPGAAVWLGAVAAGSSRWSALAFGLGTAAAAALLVRLYAGGDAAR